MNKGKEKEKKNKENSYFGSPESQSDEALVLFGGVMKMLPKELEQMGLAGKIQAREIPGVPPNWKPVSERDFLLGRVIAEREMTFKNGDQERKAKVLVFDTAVPGGFRSVWLGADLRIKLQDPVGKVYSIYYDGEKAVGRHATLNAMKSYRVFEVLPTDATIPGDVKQISE